MAPKPKINQKHVILRVRKGNGYSSLQNAALRVSPVLAHRRLMSSFTHIVPFDFEFSWMFLDSELKRLQSESKDIRIEVWAKRARRHFLVGYVFLPILESENLHQKAKLSKRYLRLVTKITDEDGIIWPEIIVSLTTQKTLPECTFHEECRKYDLYWLKYGPESEADYISDSSDLFEDEEDKSKNSELLPAPQETNFSIAELSMKFEARLKARFAKYGRKLEEKSATNKDEEIKSLKSDEIPSTISLLRSQNPQLLSAPQETNDSIDDLTMQFEAQVVKLARKLEDKSATNKDEEIKSLKSDEIPSTMSLLRSKNPQLLPAPQETNDSSDYLTMQFEAQVVKLARRKLEEKFATNKDKEIKSLKSDEIHSTRSLLRSKNPQLLPAPQETNDSSDYLTMQFEAQVVKLARRKLEEKSATYKDEEIKSFKSDEIPSTMSLLRSQNPQLLPAPQETNDSINDLTMKFKAPFKAQVAEYVEEKSIKEKHTDKTAATLRLNKIVAASFTNLHASLRPAISMKDILKYQ